MAQRTWNILTAADWWRASDAFFELIPGTSTADAGLGLGMHRAFEPRLRSCVEILAVAFGDTIIDVARVDEGARAYRIGEGEGVRVPISGDGLPDAAGFTLVWADGESFWLGFVPSMRGIVVDRDGSRSLEDLIAEGRAVAADGAHQLLLEEGETIWVEYRDVRFRVRMELREDVRVSAWSVDRPYLSSLSASAVVVLAFLALVPDQPAPRIDEDEHHAVLARLLPTVPPEPIPAHSLPSPSSGVVRDVEPALERRTAPSTPLPRPTETHTRGSRRGQSLWVPVSPTQAVGQLGRNYDPIEAARHAGILFGVHGARRFERERVFGIEADDADVWASTTDIGPTPVDAMYLPGRGQSTALVGLGLLGHGVTGPGFTRGGGTAEGVVGWGSYGAAHRIGDWRNRDDTPPTIVRIGEIEMEGAALEQRQTVRRVVRAHIPQLRSCFEQNTTDRRVNLAGDVQFSLVRGKVESVVVDPAFPDRLADCMERTIRYWRFPSSQQVSIAAVPIRMSR